MEFGAAGGVVRPLHPAGPSSGLRASQRERGAALLAILGALVVLALFIAWSARYFEGNLALLRGDRGEAEKSFRALLDENPQDRVARRRLAMTLFRAERYAEAAGEFERLFAMRDAATGGPVRPSPEETLYHALSLIGAGDRARGFELLRTFSHPVYRVVEAVREEASRLSEDMTPPEMERRLLAAWKRGEELERRERQS